MVPVLVAYLFYRKDFKKACLILLSGILIDVDHLLANPIFDPNRCSIGFHPLHTTPAILLYVGLFLFPKTRIFGLALLIHIVADTADCFLIGI